ncbi:MAG: peptidoglycan/xylan/chitin deacetylase (PgdA/CDA1 family) [Cyclobacteriaceae bacterium]|jgi:peptidoglycan/xylan/chitin deacetylase (PgdA/CDA1 family)
MYKSIKSCLALLTLALIFAPSIAQESKFNWPNDKKIAVSLTWDDGRGSQIEFGLPILNKYGIKATFYVVPSAVAKSLDGWKKAVSDGHEIGNHSMKHPCSGNFIWARGQALEEKEIGDIRKELLLANDTLNEMLNVKATEFAYPCGQTFVGRGENTKSYVPVIAREFTSGRTWMDEAPNDPSYCDLSQLTGMEMDGKNFKYILSLIEIARKDGLWLVLAGHDIGPKGRQTTEIKMLNKLFKYLSKQDDIWVAPVGEISSYIQTKRQSL